LIARTRGERSAERAKKKKKSSLAFVNLKINITTRCISFSVPPSFYNEVDQSTLNTTLYNEIYGLKEERYRKVFKINREYVSNFSSKIVYLTFNFYRRELLLSFRPFIYSSPSAQYSLQGLTFTLNVSNFDVLHGNDDIFFKLNCNSCFISNLNYIATHTFCHCLSTTENFTHLDILTHINSTKIRELHLHCLLLFLTFYYNHPLQTTYKYLINHLAHKQKVLTNYCYYVSILTQSPTFLVNVMRLGRPPDGSTSPKYKLLHF